MVIVTFPATEHHRPRTGIKLYCLVNRGTRWRRRLTASDCNQISGSQIPRSQPLVCPGLVPPPFFAKLCHGQVQPPNFSAKLCPAQVHPLPCSFAKLCPGTFPQNYAPLRYPPPAASPWNHKSRGWQHPNPSISELRKKMLIAHC